MRLRHTVSDSVKNALLFLGLTSSLALAQIVVFTPTEVSSSDPVADPAPAPRRAHVRRVADQRIEPMQDESAGPVVETTAENGTTTAPGMQALTDDPDAAMPVQPPPPAPAPRPAAAPVVITAPASGPSTATAPASTASTNSYPSTGGNASSTNWSSRPVTNLTPQEPVRRQPAAVAIVTAPAPTPAASGSASVAIVPAPAPTPAPAASQPVATTAPQRPARAAAVAPMADGQNQGKLLFQLRDLAMLSRAARMAGGSIKVKIEPVGIKVADLVGPLQQLGYFDVFQQQGGHQLVIRTKQKDPMTAQFEGQVQKLRDETFRLLDEIHRLEIARTALATSPGGPMNGYPQQMGPQPVSLRQPAPASNRPMPVVLQPTLSGAAR